MTAQDPDEKMFFPKEPLDLPRQPVSLPVEAMEIPAHAEHGRHSEEIPHRVLETYHHKDDLSGHHEEEPYTDIKTILAWHAPGRPYKKRSREFYYNALLIGIALEIIIFLFHEYTLMAVVASLVFLSYAISFVPPHNFYYKITSEGIMVEDHFFLWQELYDFYFKKVYDQEVLILRTESYYPGELVLTLGDIHKDQLKAALIRYLPYREYVKPSFMEKSGDWLSHTFPLERTVE